MAGPRRPPGPKPSSSARRPRKRASTCSVGARKPPPTTAPPRLLRRSRRAATRCVSAVDNFTPGFWSHPAFQAVFTSLYEIIQGGMMEAGRLGHPVHRCPGAVVERPVVPPLPVGFVDRERDEAGDQGGLQDDRHAGTVGFAPTARSPRLLSTRRRAKASSSRRARSTVPGGKELLRTHAVEGSRDELRQDQARPDHRQGHRAGRRFRLDRPASRRASCWPTPVTTSSPGTRSTLYGTNQDELVVVEQLPRRSSSTWRPSPPRSQPITSAVYNDPSVTKVEVK